MRRTVPAVTARPAAWARRAVIHAGDDKVHIDFKKGGVILLEGTMLRWYATPKMLVAIP